MEELTIEQKAQRYDEILKEAIIAHKDEDKHLKATLERIVHELKENEDDRIRKELVAFLKETIEYGGISPDIWTMDNANKWLAWLEKQSKQNNDEDVDILQRFSFYSYKDEPNVLYLSNVFVNEEYRNKGIGTKILKIADKVSTYLKCNSIRLKTEEGSNAESLYRKNGYKTLKEEGNQIWLEKQIEQKSVTDFSDLRTWKYIVDAVWTEREGIGQYLDSPFTEEVAKKLQKRFGNIEQKSVEEVNGEDYGIDGLWHAQRILEKTLGKVDGYQSDDGMLEHKAAITAVKKLYGQKSAAWSEEDETYLDHIITAIKSYYTDDKGKENPWREELLRWLKSLKS